MLKVTVIRHEQVLVDIVYTDYFLVLLLLSSFFFEKIIPTIQSGF